MVEVEKKELDRLKDIESKYKKSIQSRVEGAKKTNANYSTEKRKQAGIKAWKNRKKI